MAKQARKPAERFNITLPASTRERLAKIREKTDATNDSEIFRRAIRLFEGLVTGAYEISQDGKVIPLAEYLF